MATVKANFLLPVKDNDGRDLEAKLQSVRSALWARFFAYTIEGRVEGVFSMPDGAKASDKNEKYVLILEDLWLGQLEEVVRDFKRKTTQDRVYLEIQHDLEFRLI